MGFLFVKSHGSIIEFGKKNRARVFTEEVKKDLGLDSVCKVFHVKIVYGLHITHFCNQTKFRSWNDRV